MPSALAVFRLITSSNLVGCVTARSAGFSPLRIGGTIVAFSKHAQPSGWPDCQQSEDRAAAMD